MIESKNIVIKTDKEQMIINQPSKNFMICRVDITFQLYNFKQVLFFLLIIIPLDHYNIFSQTRFIIFLRVYSFLEGRELLFHHI